jgi:UDPglucose--hexose-1-phosphate uridylyltransferase
MPEFRQNLATKEWMVFATERARRPEEFSRSRPQAKALPANDPTCPFCPGHEGATPPAILALPPDTSTWDVRVIPNKFPALVPPSDPACVACASRVGPYLKRNGSGSHEVVIDTPRHNCDLPLLTEAQVTRLMEAYYLRFNALIRDPSTELVLIFRNHGPRAGTSLLHPHSQIVASAVVPFPVRNRIYEGQRYFDAFGQCVYCAMLEFEAADRTRVVMENEHFLAFCPFAASTPYETWLVPKHHRATFGAVDEDELDDLAVQLRSLLSRLWRLLDDPDYNYVIDTAPQHLAAVPFYHWHLRILPRLTTPAGFEIGSGIGINVVLPEDAARALRGTRDDAVTPEEAGIAW